MRPPVRRPVRPVPLLARWCAINSGSGHGAGLERMRLALAEAGTALAADSAGVWLAAGSARGVLSVFDCEEKADFLAAESKKINGLLP